MWPVIHQKLIEAVQSHGATPPNKHHACTDVTVLSFFEANPGNRLIAPFHRGMLNMQPTVEVATPPKAAAWEFRGISVNEAILSWCGKAWF